MPHQNELVAKLAPYISYFFYAEIIALCLAILLACFFILKRVMTRPTFEGDPTYDYERIASEIEQEIARLENLRQRLGGKKGVTKHEVESISTGPMPGGEMSKEQLNALVEERYKQQFDELRAELQKSAAEATGSAPAADIAKKDEEIKTLSAEIITLKEANKGGNVKDLSDKVAHLEKVLVEYQVFEEDFALVKKYKAEADRLKVQLEAMGGAAAAPSPTAVAQTLQAVTEADIASMFNELSGNEGAAPPTEEVAIPAAPEAAAVEVQAVATEAPPAPAEVKVEASVPAPEATTAVPAAAPTPTDVENIQVAADPSISAKPEDTEAFAESAAGDDRLIAEFEKLLGGENKS